MIKTYTLNEYINTYLKNSKFITFNSYDTIPEIIKDIILDKVENRGILRDYLTPFQKGGLSWLFSYLRFYQPRSYKILKNASNLFLAVDKMEYEKMRDISEVTLCFELNGNILNIEKDFYGFNFCDRSYEENWGIEKALPFKILYSYYFNFNGFGFPLVSLATSSILPLPTDSWSGLDSFMEDYGFKKKKRKTYLDYLEKYFPQLKKGDGGSMNLHCFLNTEHRYIKEKRDNYALFVDVRVNNGDIYVIKNDDVLNIKRLKEAEKVIDEYVSTVLMTKDSLFDFEPYLEDINIEGELIEEPDNGVKIVRYKGKYIGDLEKLEEHYPSSYQFGEDTYSQYCNINDRGYEHIGFINFEKETDVKVVEYLEYNLIEDYDDCVEYKDAEEYEFIFYSKLDLEKGDILHIYPLKFERDVEWCNQLESYLEYIFSDLELIEEKKEYDDKYINYHKDKTSIESI